MNENILTEPISRREMMKRTAIVAGALALLPTLSACEDGMNVETLAQQLRQDGTVSSANVQDYLVELVRMASLAASGHNMQPWIFEIGQDEISILPDYSRRLPVVDPQDRELWMSLGCAFENLVIAARAMGYAVQESMEVDGDERLTIRFSDGSEAADTALAAMIPQRQCHRGLYNMKFVSNSEMALLNTASELSMAKAIFVRDGTDVKTLQLLVMEGDVQQYADDAFVNELVESLRFNEREALETRDGLFSACSGNAKVPRFIGKMFVKPGMGDSQAENDRQLIDSASGLLLISSAGDSKADWISAGRVYQRTALQMTGMGIAHSFLNQPIEVPALREQVKTFLAAQTSEATTPQLLVRYGYADESMPYSLRRGVDEIVK